MQRDRSSGEAPFEEPSRPVLVAVIALTLFALVRLPLLASTPELETTEHHEFGLFAVHLGRGLIAPAADYLPEPHQGCTFVFGALCAPVLAITGPVVGGLRLCSLLLHAGIAMVFALLAARVAGFLAGLIAAGLFAAAPSAMLHLAHKGSTNHDDADLFVAAALLLMLPLARDGARGVLARAAGAGALVGLAAAYMADGGLRGLVMAAVALLLIRGRRRDVALAGAAGLLVSLGLAAALGIRPGGGDSAIALAFAQSPLAPDGGPGLVDRLGLFFTSALPHTFTVSPGPLGGVITDRIRFWIYPALLTPLVATAAWGWRRSQPAGRGAERRLVVAAALAVVTVHLAAVLLSGVDPGISDYLVPVWPWLVALAAIGATGLPGGRPWRRAAGALGGGLAVLICLPGTLVPIGAVLRVPEGLPPQAPVPTADQATFMLSLPGSRVTRGRLGQRLLEADPRRLVEIVSAERPGEEAEFARLRGWAAASVLVEQTCPSRPGAAPPPPPPQPGPAAQTIHWEGVGEGAARWSGLCRPLLENGRTRRRGDLALALARSTWVEPAASAHVVRGLALAALDQRDGDFEGLELDFAPGEDRRQLCIAAGQWGFLSMRITELRTWLAESGACPSEQIAAGWAMALARDWPAGREPPLTPRWWWWWVESTARTEGVFECAWQAERANVAALIDPGARSLPRPIEECLVATDGQP